MHFFFTGGKTKQKAILDQLSFGTGYAYSLRKMTSKATNAIKVRRSSDNTELDIGFSGNDLDTTSLLSFVGSVNLIKYSENITATGWSSAEGGATALAGAGIAPDGTQTAGSITYPLTTSKWRYAATGLTANTQYTFSIWIKVETGTFKLKISSTDTTTWVTATVSDELTINTGWVKYSLTFTTHGTQTVASFIIGDENKNSGYNLPATGTILAWGAQLNEGSSVGIYNRTNGGIGGDGYVVTWYNQFGGAVNPTQATASDQPRIVSGGVLYLQGGKPSVEWTTPTQTSMGLFYTTIQTRQILSVFSMGAGIGTNSRLNGGLRILASNTTWVDAFLDTNGVAVGSLNSETLVDFDTIPVIQTATITPLQIINCQSSTATSIGMIIGNLGGLARSWYGGISETIYFSTVLSPIDTGKLLKDQSKYYGVTLV